MTFSIRTLYLYLFAAVGLIITIIGVVQAVSFTLETFFIEPTMTPRSFYTKPIIEGEVVKETEAQIQEREAYERASREESRRRELISIVSMLVVGIPLYAYHWRMVSQEGKKH